MNRLRRLFIDEGGQAAVEYGLIAAALITCLVVAGGGIVQIQKGVYDSQHKSLQDWRAP